MQTRMLRWIATLAAAALGIGCAHDGTILRRTPRLGDARALATSADIRLVTVTPIIESNGTRRQITCAEPSPDIAKAVAEAFGASSALAVRAKSPEAPVEGSADTTNALTRSYAESVGQMTERLATIQLLRDGLYRACEAYANGILNKDAYGVLLSRYDDTMVTMLLAELAAGNFGRSLVALGGTASGSAKASLAVKKAQQKVAEAQDQVDKETEDVSEAEKRQDEVAEKEGASAGEQEQTRKDKEKQEGELAAAEKKQQDAEEELERALSVEATSKAAATATAASAIARDQAKANEAIAKTVAQMQANYLNDHNVDALKVVCLTGARDNADIAKWCDHFVKWLETEHDEFRRKVTPTANDSSLLQQIFVGAKHPLGGSSDGSTPK